MFDILTFCSANYDAALKFSMPSFLSESGCERIVIYSDGKVGKDWDKVEQVEFREEFEPSEDWHVWALRKPIVVQKYLKTVPEGQKFCLMDLDCFAVNGEWGSAFKDGWLGAIRWDKTVEDPSNKKAVSVFFATKRKEMVDFVDHWADLTEQMSKVIPWSPGFQGVDQMAYQTCIDVFHKEVGGIYPLSENIWSSENDSLYRWFYLVKKYRQEVKILHFKGGRWKDVKLFNEVRGIVNGF